MTDFGFSLSKSSSLDLTKVDLALYRKVCQKVPSARLCMNCGSCSATCPAQNFSGMSFRKMLLSIQRGIDIRPIVANCMLCGKCTMVCPRGVNTRNTILTICQLYD